MTLIGMVRNMMTMSKLPRFLWGETLTIANYILNRVPSKAISSTPFEMWQGMVPNFSYFHVWGCKAEVKFYNSCERKLDPRTQLCYFIGYPKKSKGYRFYIPQGYTRVQETHNAMFLEDQDILDLSRENFIFEEIEHTHEYPVQADSNLILLFPHSMTTSIQDLSDEMDSDVGNIGTMINLLQLLILSQN